MISNFSQLVYCKRQQCISPNGAMSQHRGSN